MSPFQALYGDRPANVIDALVLPPHIIQKLNRDDLSELAGKVKWVTKDSDGVQCNLEKGKNNSITCSAKYGDGLSYNWLHKF